MLLALFACSPPPPAPEGLDAASSYLVREFYSDDATFQAGVQGFMQWFEDEGHELVGEAATTDNTEAFTVGDLTNEDVAHLPLDEELLVDPDTDTWEKRDVGNAAGVVSLAEMDCTWQESEEWLLRADQDTIFTDDWEGYERTYVTSKDAYTGASSSGDYDSIEEALSPFEDGFDTGPYERTLLFTENLVDPSPVLFADMPAYEMNLDFRHGAYEIGDEQLSAFAILTWHPAAVWGDGGENGLLQTYSVEINVERTSGKTLRMLAVWAQPVGAGLEPDDAFVLNYAVNKSLSSSERMSEVCAEGL